MIKTLVTEAVVKQMADLENLEVGSDKYETAVDGVTKLIDKAMEMEQYEIDREDRLAVQTEELNIKQAQVDAQCDQADKDLKVKIVQVAATIGIAVLTAAITVWGTNTTLEYEENGIAPTTNPGRKFMDRLFRS